MYISNKEILSKLPEDFSPLFIRDISVFTCSILVESTANNMKNFFGANFSSNLFLVDEKQATWYFSVKELEKYSESLGKKLRKNSNFVGYLSENLKQMTDWFFIFINNNPSKKDFLRASQIFIHLFRIFFAFHFTIRIGGEYLARIISNGSKNKNLVSKYKILEEAWNYNEMVVPTIEKYLKKIGLAKFCYFEINNDIKNLILTDFYRSSIFIDETNYTLSLSQSIKLQHVLQRRQLREVTYLKKLQGKVANKGKVRGKAKIITELSKLNTLKGDEILFTSNTRPHFNFYIKKVKAIVTDEGGTLCHAALLAREFNIPCIIDTKIGTKVFKDGDRVEVDATRGLVKKI